MSVDIAQIANLEWINYAASQAIIEQTPDLDLCLKDEVILTSSQSFPAPDTTHACRLRATAQTVEGLIDEVIDYFQSKGLPPTIYLSPACTPSDLPVRLKQRGFEPQSGEEAWLVLEGFSEFAIPPAFPDFSIRKVTQDEIQTFADVFLASFEMPVEFSPFLADLLGPSVSLPGVHHYLAWTDEEPVGTCTLICYQEYGILGSMGVLPSHRQSGAGTNLAVEAGHQAKALGIDIVVLQTAANTFLEQVLCMAGFQRAFTRICYTLS